MIGSGVDTGIYNPSISHENPFPDLINDKFLIVMVIRLVEEKGVVQFLEAAVAASKIKANLYFVLIGERLDSDHASSVDKILSKSKRILKHRLISAGLRDYIPTLLGGWTFFCLPSWREGMPRTIIEAMVMGLPVIATNTRGSREEVIDGEIGILVPSKDTGKFTEAIIGLSSDKEMCQKMRLKDRESSQAV